MNLYRYWRNIPILLTTTLVYCQGFPNGHGGPARGRASHPPAARVACKGNERYHVPTSKCLPLGIQGPCGDNMIFKADPSDNAHGYCDCIDHLNCEYWPFAFSRAENKCYPLFQQGPCREGEWVEGEQERREHKGRHQRAPNPREKDHNLIHSVCKPNPCPPSSEGRSFSHKGQCYVSNTRGFCASAQERMTFTKGSAKPKCLAQPAKPETCTLPNIDGGPAVRTQQEVPVRRLQEVSVSTPPSLVMPVLLPAGAQVRQTSTAEPMEVTTTTPEPKLIAKVVAASCKGDKVKTVDQTCSDLSLFR